MIRHYLRVPLETAIARSTRRAADDTRGAHILSAAALRHLASIFEEPSSGEGMELRIVGD